MNRTSKISAWIVACTAPHPCAYCDRTSSGRDQDVIVATFVRHVITGAITWVCSACAARHAPRLVEAIDRYHRELVALVDDGLIQPAEGRGIFEESLDVLTGGLDPAGWLYPPAVGTDSDVTRLERAARHVAVRRATRQPRDNS